MQIKHLLLSLCTVLLWQQMNTAFATQTGDSMNISFTGRLMNRKPCTVSDGKIILVNFGNVNVNNVTNDHVIKDLDYSLNCPDATSDNTVQLTIRGTPITGDSTVIASSAAGLWMKFLKDGEPQALNTAFVVDDWRNPPGLTIELEKDPSTELNAGAFTGTVTLISEYF